MNIQISEVTFDEYQFPIIYHIDEVLEAIRDKEEFRVIDRDDHLIVDYVFTQPTTFPPVKYPSPKMVGGPGKWVIDREAMLLRECRGIGFDKSTGVIIRRPPHKFFNLNEREETRRVNWGSPHRFLEKMDGSCISVYKTLNSRMIWGTPAGETVFTPMVEEFVKANPQYQAVAELLVDSGWTPAFEFCSRKNRVVLDHPVDRLVLHSVRNIVMGDYLPYDQMKAFEEYGIEVVKAHELNTIDDAVKYIDGREDTEGLIVRFDSGHMIKMKTEWYCALHSVTTGIRFEKDALSLIMSGTLDDAKPFLPQDMADKLDDYARQVHEGLMQSARYVAECIQDVYWLFGEDKKRYAEAFRDDPFFAFIMGVFDDIAGKHRTGMLRDAQQLAYDRLHKFVKERTETQTWIDKRRFAYGGLRFEL